MNDYFRKYAYKIAETYKKDLRMVATDLLSLEGKINAYQVGKGARITNNYFLTAAGRLSAEYKKWRIEIN